MSDFWSKVEKCNHKNLYENYIGGPYCSTPYCYAWEDHCKDCGVFISKCKCGCENGMSGWSSKRWSKKWKKMI